MGGNYPALLPELLRQKLFSLNGEMNALTISPMLTLRSDAGDIERNKVDAMFYPVVN